MEELSGFSQSTANGFQPRVLFAFPLILVPFAS